MVAAAAAASSCTSIPARIVAASATALSRSAWIVSTLVRSRSAASFASDASRSSLSMLSACAAAASSASRSGAWCRRRCCCCCCGGGGGGGGGCGGCCCCCCGGGGGGGCCGCCCCGCGCCCGCCCCGRRGLISLCTRHCSAGCCAGAAEGAAGLGGSCCGGASESGRRRSCSRTVASPERTRSSVGTMARCAPNRALPVAQTRWLRTNLGAPPGFRAVGTRDTAIWAHHAAVGVTDVQAISAVWSSLLPRRARYCCCEIAGPLARSRGATRDASCASSRGAEPRQ